MEIWKKILLAILGAGCGAGATWLVISKLNKDKTKEEVKPENGNRLGWKPPEEEVEVEELMGDTDGDDLLGETYTEKVNTIMQGASIIDESEFSTADPIEFPNKNFLVWYQESECLVDSDEEIVPHPERIIGEDAVDKFRTMKDSDFLYVQNDKLKSVYEIKIDGGAFPGADTE